MHFALRQVKFSGASTLDGQLLSGAGQLSGQGQFNDVKLDKIEMQASMKRLHAPSYERLMQHTMETSVAACGLKQSISPQVMLAEVQKDLTALLPYNPEYALDKLAVESGGQRGEIACAMGVNGVTPDDAAMPASMLTMTHAQMHGRVRLPVAWIQAAVARFGTPSMGLAPADAASAVPAVDATRAPVDPAAQPSMVDVVLNKMTSDGYFVRDGDALTTEFRLDKGQMVVNGKSLGRPPQTQ